MKNGRRMCLRCRGYRRLGTCKQGHKWTAKNTRIAKSGQRVCRACMREWRAKWKRANPEMQRAQRLRRLERRPELAEHSRLAARQWRADNLEAALAKAQRWRDENPERVRESYREWSAANPGSKRVRDNVRRARKAQASVCGPLPARVYASVLSSGPCVYCAALATEVDHVKPLSRGGIEHAMNLVPACKSCNSGKKDRLLDEWDQVRVTRAVKVSRAVRDEWDLIQTGQGVLF